MQTSDLVEQIKLRVQEKMVERQRQAEPVPTVPTVSAPPARQFSGWKLGLPVWAIPAFVLTAMAGGFGLSAVKTVVAQNPEVVKQESMLKALQSQQEANTIATTEAIREAGTDFCLGDCAADSPPVEPSPVPAAEPSPSPSPSPVPVVEPSPLAMTEPAWNPGRYQNAKIYYWNEILSSLNQYGDFGLFVSFESQLTEPEQKQAFNHAFQTIRGGWVEWCAANNDGVGILYATDNDRKICNSLR